MHEWESSLLLGLYDDELISEDRMDNLRQTQNANQGQVCSTKDDCVPGIEQAVSASDGGELPDWANPVETSKVLRQDTISVLAKSGQMDAGVSTIQNESDTTCQLVTKTNNPTALTDLGIVQGFDSKSVGARPSPASTRESRESNGTAIITGSSKYNKWKKYGQKHLSSGSENHPNNS